MITDYKEAVKVLDSANAAALAEFVTASEERGPDGHAYSSNGPLPTLKHYRLRTEPNDEAEYVYFIEPF